MSIIPGGVATVTGGASGMGRQTALSFAREGVSSLVLGDLSEPGLAETARMIAEQSPSVEVEITKLDVSDEASVQKFVDLAVSKFGRIDYAINAAGMAPPITTFYEAPASTVYKAVAVNTKGVFLCCRAQIKQMLKQEPSNGLTCRGSIVNITSLAGHGGAFESLPAYTGSKAAPEALTRSMAQDYGPHNIRINAIAPGFTLTPMLKGFANQDVLDYVAGITPMRRLASPEDIANGCLLLSSAFAGFIHGQSLAVDGGLSLEHYC